MRTCMYMSEYACASVGSCVRVLMCARYNSNRTGSVSSTSFGRDDLDSFEHDFNVLSIQVTRS